MFKKLQQKWKHFRLRGLNANYVKYVPENEEILIRKGKIKVDLKAAFVTENDEYLMKVSGDPIVLDNQVMQAIWSVLWNTTINSTICFCDTKIWADPTFLQIRKDEIIPMPYVKNSK